MEDMNVSRTKLCLLTLPYMETVGAEIPWHHVQIRYRPHASTPDKRDGNVNVRGLCLQASFSNPLALSALQSLIQRLLHTSYSAMIT